MLSSLPYGDSVGEPNKILKIFKYDSDSRPDYLLDLCCLAAQEFKHLWIMLPTLGSQEFLHKILDIFTSVRVSGNIQSTFSGNYGEWSWVSLVPFRRSL